MNVLADTLARYPGCNCHKLGLVAGVYVSDLHLLGAGCTTSLPDIGRPRGTRPGYVCPRLDAIRRFYSPWRLPTGE
jgi:hypothetical protein